jgi:hypothetical protein
MGTGKFGLGGNPAKAKALLICAMAALLGGVLAAAVAGAQGAGDYQPSTTTVTSTVPGSTTTVPRDDNLRLRLKGTKGKQKLPGPVKVKASCVVESCFVSAIGKFAIRVRHGNTTRHKLKNDVASLGVGETETLKLKLPNGPAKKAEREAPRADTKVKSRVVVNANDDAGNTKEKTRRIKLKP